MESAYFWNCVGRCSQLHSDDDCEECVVEMHIPPKSWSKETKSSGLEGPVGDSINDPKLETENQSW